jgi:arylsulfatase A-like enzyme
MKDNTVRHAIRIVFRLQSYVEPADRLSTMISIARWHSLGADAVTKPPERASSLRPNIILITTDQQRYDALGVNGNAQIRTPHIDRLASMGVHFTHAYVQNTVCVPSRACIQTGRYTHQHGVTYMETVVDATPGLPAWERTFMEHLQAHGYYTGATGKIHMYPEKGFHWHRLTGGKGQRWLVPQGSPLGPGPLGPVYAAWLESKRPGAYDEIYAARRRQPSYAKLGVMDTPVSADEYVDDWIGQESVHFIESAAQRDGPFFLWCGFCGPHGPFDPPEPYRSLYAPQDVPLPLELEGWPSWRERWDEALMRKAIAYYWAMVTCIDDQVGRIIDALQTQGVFENTLILYTSDHGEFLGERGRTGKGLFYDSIIHVPMWILPPQGTPCQPRAIQGLTEVMSIAPTILDYAGIPLPGPMTARSLRPVLEGVSNGREMVFCEYVTNDKARWAKCVRTATHKYIRWWPDLEEEFYDLVSDPLEGHNLAQTGAQSERMGQLKDAMFDWLARTEWRHNYAFEV